jgi:hypothetical protein
MRQATRYLFRMSTIVLAVVAVSIGVLKYSTTTKVFADPPPPCPNLECESICWSDGTHPNQGTKVIHKSPTLLECGNNDGTCITQPCH